MSADQGPDKGPSVRLLNYFEQPYNNAVATARTCYSSRVILPDEVAQSEERRAQRDRIASSVYKAGHHTTLQHSTFQFILEGISRQFIWSFLHAHPFYNSEQVSQRYVEVKEGNYYIPPLSEKAREIYVETVEKQTQAYQKLLELLYEPALVQYRKIFPKRDLTDKKWQNAVKKKCLEVARYVLPVCTFTHLYHTISGLTIHRYHRLSGQMDVPEETRLVVDKMVAEVLRIDPDFSKNLEDPFPLEETLEFKALALIQPEAAANPGPFIEEFDQSLGTKTSLLIGFNPHAQSNIGSGVRSVLGLTQAQLSNDQAIEMLLDPKQNKYLADSLNLQSLSKLTRALHHCHLTFRKKLSHSADSQDQRHRLTPGSRPLLSQHFRFDHPDYIVPPLIRESAQAEEVYHEIMKTTWQGISALAQEGCRLEHALYLLPNSFPIRFEESGDLMAFHHKWTTRLCYTAQEEIWNNCRDEVLQVQKVFPEIALWLHPPCTLRKMAHVTPYCPEGDRFCGVRVWNLQVEEFSRLL